MKSREAENEGMLRDGTQRLRAGTLPALSTRAAIAKQWAEISEMEDENSYSHPPLIFLNTNFVFFQCRHVEFLFKLLLFVRW